MLPDLITSEYILPCGTIDIGDGYVMLMAMERVTTYLCPCEVAALCNFFFAASGPVANLMNFCKVMWWAHICLPNRQIA